MNVYPADCQAPPDDTELEEGYIQCPCCGEVTHQDEIYDYPVIIPGLSNTWAPHCPECGTVLHF